MTMFRKWLSWKLRQTASWLDPQSISPVPQLGPDTGECTHPNCMSWSDNGVQMLKCLNCDRLLSIITTGTNSLPNTWTGTRPQQKTW